MGSEKRIQRKSTYKKYQTNKIKRGGKEGITFSGIVNALQNDYKFVSCILSVLITHR